MTKQKGGVGEYSKGVAYGTCSQTTSEREEIHRKGKKGNMCKTSHIEV